MSLREAYNLAHSAECRLHLQATRPDRNLRFLVGHLLTYESMRLRIVEIEHDISSSEQASAVKFKGTGHASSNSGALQPQRKPSAGQLGVRRSPPPPQRLDDSWDGDDNHDDASDSDSTASYDGEFSDDDDDDADGGGLQRFPSGASAPHRHAPAPSAHHPPPLEADSGEADDDEDDSDDPPSPEEPDEATLAQITKGAGDVQLTKMYNGMKKCPCHDQGDAPEFANVWTLPIGKDGKTRAVAEVV